MKIRESTLYYLVAETMFTLEEMVKNKIPYTSPVHAYTAKRLEGLIAAIPNYDPNVMVKFMKAWEGVFKNGTANVDM